LGIQGCSEERKRVLPIFEPNRELQSTPSLPSRIATRTTITDVFSLQDSGTFSRTLVEHKIYRRARGLRMNMRWDFVLFAGRVRTGLMFWRAKFGRLAGGRTVRNPSSPAPPAQYLLAFRLRAASNFQRTPRSVFDQRVHFADRFPREGAEGQAPPGCRVLSILSGPFPTRPPLTVSGLRAQKTHRADPRRLGVDEFKNAPI